MNLIGQNIGRYHIVEQLGEGGMAIVYKAYDTNLERDVAIKVIRTDMIGPAMLGQMLKRFEREAKSLAKMKHRDIVSIYEYGDHEGSPYLVMEYLQGGTLKTLTGRPIPYQDAAKLLLPIARALDYAHKRGVLHRDVKPANILINEDGDPLLSDFGIAKMLESGQETQLTGTGVGIGTPEYMAPEQWTGKVLPQTDIYALGIVLFELITGSKPFTADTPAAILLKQANDPLPRPKDFAPDLPDEVEKVLFKALAKQPEDRYPVMGEFAKALEQLSAKSGQASVETLVRPPDDEEQDDRVAKHPRRAAEGAVQTLVEMAQDYQAEGNLTGAADLYRRALEKCPADTTQAQEIQAAMEKLDIPLQKQPAATPAPQGTPSRDRQAAPVASSPRSPIASRPGSSPSEPSKSRSTRASIPVRAWVLAGVVGLLVIGAVIIGGIIAAGSAYAGQEIMAEIMTSSTPSETLTPSQKPTITPGIGSTQVSAKDGMVMIYVPAGDFEMGSTNGESDEEPVHTVYLDTFWIDRTEVTNSMFQAFVDATGYKTDAEKDGASYVIMDGSWEDTAGVDWQHPQGSGSSLSGLGNHPVVHVSWNDASAYCEWAGKRLPSEPEWEKAARGTDGRTYPWGESINSSLANYKMDVGGTAEVGSYPDGTSPYGALDLAGNVWEWAQDWYGENYYSSSPDSNPSGPSSGDYRVLRGGSWSADEDRARSAERSTLVPNVTSSDSGFRCATSP
jgi:formylglycine-generating enzyme required for sulfatase activity/tRNA A-37 threonylcarbamoyl transferase component Bud32